MKYILILLTTLFINCQKQILILPNESKLLGVWQEKGYNTKIEINEITNNK